MSILAVALLGGRDDGTSRDDTDTGASSQPTSSVATSTTASASATAGSSGSPEASPGPVAVDAVVATTVEGLLVRDAPGIDAARLGTLASGTIGFVAAGPTEADGFPWYAVSAMGLPPNSGCATPIETEPLDCPVWFGWVAGASETGEPWLEVHEIECPTEPVTAEGLILARTNLERLACFGNEPLTFRAWWPEIPDDAGLGLACVGEGQPSGWLLCQNINYTWVTINETEGFGGVGAQISIDPASGLSMPERGTWVEVRVHLDDPAAQGCDEAAGSFDAESPAERYVLDCRAQLVLESVTAVDGP